VPELTAIWVANRNNPIASTDNLILLAGDRKDQNRNQTQTQVPIWSTNVSAGLNSSSPLSVRILDSGNFALFSSSNSTILWQSVDYPTNTFLPGAKLRLDRKSKVNRRGKLEPLFDYEREFSRGALQISMVRNKGALLFKLCSYKSLFFFPFFSCTSPLFGKVRHFGTS
ncbi:unnamed protein product, partial [Linum tenue]